MRRAIFLTLALGSLSFATTMEENLQSAIKKVAGVDIKVITSKEIKSMGVNLVIAQAPDGSKFPIYASKDGTSFIGFSSVMGFPDEEMRLVQIELDTIAKANQGAMKEQTSKLFASLPKERFLFLPSSDKSVKKSLIVVSDPDCPYCKQELGNIEERLKSANIKIIFAPVHDDTAFIKSQLIMDEAKKLKESDVKGKVALLKKYFEKIELSEAQKKTDISKIKDNAAKIFGTGIITGVPFVFEAE